MSYSYQNHIPSAMLSSYSVPPPSRHSETPVPTIQRNYFFPMNSYPRYPYDDEFNSSFYQYPYRKENHSFPPSVPFDNSSLSPHAPSPSMVPSVSYRTTRTPRVPYGTQEVRGSSYANQCWLYDQANLQNYSNQPFHSSRSAFPPSHSEQAYYY